MTETYNVSEPRETHGTGGCPLPGSGVREVVRRSRSSSVRGRTCMAGTRRFGGAAGLAVGAGMGH